MISANDVQELYAACLFNDEELPQAPRNLGDLPENAIVTEGAITTTGFHALRILEHRLKIVALLKELPPNFDFSVGGGWSLMQAVEDKDGNLWGEQRDADMLMQLGMAIGIVKYVLPRHMWSVLPGHMPYLAFYFGNLPLFETLNHPDPEEDGTQLYDMFMVFPETDVQKKYVPIMRNLTREQADAFVAENGAYNP